jgi:Na+-driven multidrug efflux pump
MARVFTNDVDLIIISTHALRIANCAFFLVGFQMVIGNFFTSIGMAKKAIFLSLTRQVLFLVPLILLLPEIWGITGVWAAIPVSDTISAVVAILMLNYQLNRFRDYGDELPIETNIEKYSEDI